MNTHIGHWNDASFSEHIGWINDDAEVYGNYYTMSRPTYVRSYIADIPDENGKNRLIRFIKIERTMIAIERRLSVTSGKLGIGTLAGIAKCVIGVVQAIVGLVVGIFASFGTPCSRSAREYAKFSAQQFVHGIGNICAGIIEAIPGVQQLALKERQVGILFVPDLQLAPTGYGDKLMPYTNLNNYYIDAFGLGENSKITNTPCSMAPMQKVVSGRI